MFFFFIARDETLRIRLETDTSSAEGKAQSADAARNGKPRLESLRHPGYTLPPTQAFLGELVFHPSPQTPAQPKTTFLSHT